MYLFEDRVDLDFDGAFLPGPALSWVARNNSKPGRPESEAWVVHAGPEWTGTHSSLSREAAADALERELEAFVGPLRAPFIRNWVSVCVATGAGRDGWKGPS